jgi:hypothetical protein
MEDVDPGCSSARLQWARASMEATVDALAAARQASHEEAQDLAWRSPWHGNTDPTWPGTAGAEGPASIASTRRRAVPSERGSPSSPIRGGPSTDKPE